MKCQLSRFAVRASGAPEIGMLVAQELQIDYVDSKIIADVAARLNRHEIEVIKKETPPRTIFGRVARALATGGGLFRGLRFK